MHLTLMIVHSERFLKDPICLIYKCISYLKLYISSQREGMDAVFSWLEEHYLEQYNWSCEDSFFVC